MILAHEIEVRILYPKPEVFYKGVPQTAIWACLGSKCSRVRISPPLPISLVNKTADEFKFSVLSLGDAYVQ